MHLLYACSSRGVNKGLRATQKATGVRDTKLMVINISRPDGGKDTKNLQRETSLRHSQKWKIQQ